LFVCGSSDWQVPTEISPTEVWKGVLVEPLAGDHSCFTDREVSM
jgi:hypothetical protein